MPNNCPVIHVTSKLDYESLKLKVENINVMKPVKKGGEATKNGYTLKIQFSYDFNGKNYKCDNLRVRFDSGKIKRISTGPTGYDLSSFTSIDENSLNYNFLKYLHECVSEYLVDNVTKIQPNIYIQAMLNYDEEFGDKFNKKNKNVAETVAELKNHFETFDDDKKKAFEKALSKSVRDTFRFHRKKNQDWCLLKPSTMSEESFNMGLAVYKPRDDHKPYDIKVYEVDQANGSMKRMLSPDEFEDAVGGSEKKGMIDYEHLIVELKNPHMNASEEAVSFGFIIRFVGISSAEEEEYDPITNTFKPKPSNEIKRSRDSEDDNAPVAKKVCFEEEPSNVVPNKTQAPLPSPDPSDDDADQAADQDAAFD